MPSPGSRHWTSTSSLMTVFDLSFFLSPPPELDFLSFQGSEWNAANFEELQKNKWVLWPAQCVVLLLKSSSDTQFCHSWVIPLPLVSYPLACQCGLHPECDEGDWQLLPGVLHLHEHQTLWCGSFRPAASLDRHLQLYWSRKVCLCYSLI